MALRSIKDKITNVAGSEVLGETDGKSEDLTDEEIKKKAPRRRTRKAIKQPEEAPKKPARKKTKAPKVNKGAKVTNKDRSRRDNEKGLFNREGLFNRGEKAPEKKVKEPKEVKRGDERVDDLVVHEEGVMEGYKDVLAILGIKEKIELDVDFRSHDLDYINFGQTTPVGLDYDEVSDFISRTKYTLHKLESTLKQREKDVVAVASEVKKIEQRMIEQNQEKELERMVGGMTQEERLIEEVMELRVDNNELRREKEALNKEIAELKAAAATMQTNNEKAVVKVEKKLPTPPSSNLNEEDIFGDMLNDIGGLYDE